MSWQFLMEIRLPIRAVATPRHKTTARGGKARMYPVTKIGKKGNTRPHPILAYRLALCAAFKDEMKKLTGIKWPLTCPVRFDELYLFKRTGKKSAERTPRAAEPDRDNVSKTTGDITQPQKNLKSGIRVGCGMLKNDSQICSGPVEKWTAATGEGDWVIITVSTWTTDTPKGEKQ